MYVTHRSFAAPAPATRDFFWLYHTYSLLRGGFYNAGAKIKNLMHQKVSKTLSKQLFERWKDTGAWLLIQKSTNSLLNNDNSPYHSTRSL